MFQTGKELLKERVIMDALIVTFERKEMWWSWPLSESPYFRAHVVLLLVILVLPDLFA